MQSWTWRAQTGFLLNKKDDKTIARKVRERFFLSTQTYRNMKFAICGFVQYARDLLSHPSGKIAYVNSGHSNTSALESRFSIVKRSGLNDTSKYHLVAANLNTVATMKHKKREAASFSRKVKAGNSSYPADQIAPERPEAASMDFTVGKLVQQRKKKVDSCFEEWRKTAAATPKNEVILRSTQPQPSTKVCKHLLPLFQARTVPEGSFVEMWRKEETIRDLMVLTIENVNPHHWESLRILFSDEDAIDLEEESRYLVELAFQLLDGAIAAAKLSYKSSFWWQVMNRIRNGSLHHTTATNPLKSKLIRSYLFQLISGKVYSWATEMLKGSVEQAGIVHARKEILPGATINYSMVASDVNTFIGFSLFSLKKKYGVVEELAPGYAQEDKYWLLTDMIAVEDDVRNDEEYLTTYYDTYYVILNRGDMTLVAPRYAKLFHGMLFQIARSVNITKMVEDKNMFLLKARAEVKKHLPAWSKSLLILSDGVHLVHPEKACCELLEEILEKTFNAKGSAVLKRYRSMYLARGGKEASQSSLRETQKQSGLGRKKTRKERENSIEQSSSSGL